MAIWLKWRCAGLPADPRDGRSLPLQCSSGCPCAAKLRPHPCHIVLLPPLHSTGHQAQLCRDAAAGEAGTVGMSGRPRGVGLCSLAAAVARRAAECSPSANTCRSPSVHAAPPYPMQFFAIGACPQQEAVGVPSVGSMLCQDAACPCSGAAACRMSRRQPFAAVFFGTPVPCRLRDDGVVFGGAAIILLR